MTRNHQITHVGWLAVSPPDAIGKAPYSARFLFGDSAPGD